MAAQVLVAPSLLAADFSKLGDEVRRAEEAGADMLHIDIMDGHFVPNLTMGPALIKSLRKLTRMHFDVHLMLDNPQEFIEPFADAGADGLTVHLEVFPEPEEILGAIGERGLSRGLCINPDMPVERLEGHLGSVDRLLLMSVFPGFGGQKFIEDTIERLTQAAAMIDRRTTELQVDGGIYLENAARVISAGANNLVSGTGTFGAADMKEAIETMRG